MSSEVFAALDDYMWKLTYKWARHVHPNKSAHWVVARYFDRFNKARRDRWVFGDRESGAYLRKFAWTRIVRHQMVKSRASPDDPDPGRVLGQAAAQGTAPTDRQDQPTAPQGPGRSLSALREPAPIRRRPATKPTSSGSSGWQSPARRSSRSPLREDGTSDETEPRLIHAHCHRRHTADDGKGTALLPAHEP